MDSEKILFLSGVSLAVAVGLYVLWGPTTAKKRKKAGIIGLVNLGHTCFLNTLLQALASCPTFISWLSWHANREFRFRDGYSSHNRTFSSLAAAIYKVILVLNGNEANEQSEDGYAYAPYCVLDALGKRGWAISPGEQDAHELFHALLSTIGEEIEANNSQVPMVDQSNRSLNGLSLNSHKPSITDALTPSENCGAGLERLRISTDNQVNEGILSLTNEITANSCTRNQPLKEKFTVVSLSKNELGLESGIHVVNEVDGSLGKEDGECDGRGEESGVKIVLNDSVRGSEMDISGHLAMSEHGDGAKCADLLGKDLLSVYASSYPGSPNASRSPVSVQSPTHSSSPTGSPKVNQLCRRARSSIAVNSRQRVLRYSDGRYTSQLFESNSWDNTGGLVSSPSGSPFRGFLTSQMKCMSCNFKSAVRYDKFDSLSLSLPPRGVGSDMGYLLGNAKKGVTLEYLLHRFVSREIVEGVTCEGCTLKRTEELEVDASCDDKTSSPVKATFLKWLNFGRLPKCLCFHIQRTTWFDGGQTSKRHDFVAFPEYLCMEMYTYLQVQASVRDSKGGNLKVLKEENTVNNRLSKSQQSLEMERTKPKAPLSPPVKAEKSALKMDMGIPSKSEGRLWHRPSIHKRNTFRLTAVVVHVGDSNSGHFVTYRRGPPQSSNARQKGLGSPFKRNGELNYPLSRSVSVDDSRWYYTSDTEIVECSINKVLESVAYMLFYEKVLPSQG